MSFLDSISYRLDNSFWLYASSLVGIVLLGLYVGSLLFGTNSLEVLMELKSQKSELEQSAQSLQVENARLQKELFELKYMEP